jgi:hypothetical protein
MSSQSSRGLSASPRGRENGRGCPSGGRRLCLVRVSPIASRTRGPYAGIQRCCHEHAREPSGTRAQQSLPSWAVVGTRDHAIPAPEQLFIAQRARSQIAKVLEGHLSLITRADTIIAASH